MYQENIKKVKKNEHKLTLTLPLFLFPMFPREYCLPRITVLTVAQALMAVGHLLLAFAVPGSLYLGSLIIGLCFGAHWAIMPATASELFGLKNFGMIYNVLAIANPLASYIFSDLIAAYFYEVESKREAGGIVGVFLRLFHFGNWSTQGLGPRSLLGGSVKADCSGAHCFKTTFLIMVGVCLCGVCFDLILASRTKSVYVMLYGKPAHKVQPAVPADELE